MLAKSLRLFFIVSAVLFVAAKIFLFTGIGVDPVLLHYIANDPNGGAAAVNYIIGFILGGLLYLLPFLVAYIRENPEAWYILIAILLVPFAGGFFVGMLGTVTPAAVSLDSFVSNIITPAAWCVGLIWAFSNKHWVTITKTFPKE